MTPLEHALYYASRGWRVVPIPPGHKYPHGIDDWQTKATTEPTHIRKYWTLNPDHGIGIAMGPATGLIAIDIDSYAGGDEGWTELEATHGAAPDTIEAVTGGGGRHLLFKHPDDGGPVITNAAHALPPGIDVRGEGGQIVVAPTIHPGTGQPYAWEIHHDPFDGAAPADPPAWLLQLLRTPAPNQQARHDRAHYDGTDSIVDRFAADHTWPQLLTPAGWQFHSARTDSAGTFELWTRPGKDVKDGASASLYYHGSDVLKVFTSSAPPLVAQATYTRFGFWTALEHHGDHTAAASVYRRTINGTPAPSAVTTETAPQQQPTTVGRRKPGIVHNGRQLEDVVDDAVAALRDDNDPPTLFVRAGQVARLRADEDDRALIEALRPDHAKLALASSADWWRALKDGGLTATSPPAEVAASILAIGTWPFPPLAGVVELPVLRPDGTFHTDHGYDPATRLYHWHQGHPYPTITDQPTIADLTESVALIDDTLCDFPWDSTADRANAWALILTPLVRAIVGQVPMALVDAPEPGTGKGLLIKAASLITTGRSAALMAWPASDEELEKKVTATLMAGNTVVVFDNVEGMIKSPTLAAVLTADHWQGRILGKSEVITVPNRATWAATGNNIDVGGDLARRCYRIRLDARQAQPWLRTGFKHADLEQWITTNRNRLLHALCTIIRSWWTAGQPLADNLPAMGGYSSWVRTIGGILDHAGVNGFLANLAEFHASADHEANAWHAFLTAWDDEYGEQPLTVAELIAKMADIYAGPRIRPYLPDDLSGYWDTPGFSRRFSLALRKRVGRHYGDGGLHVIEMPRDRRNVAIYSVTVRSNQLFDTTPALDGPATCDDATCAGVAGVHRFISHTKNSYPQAPTEMGGAAGRTTPATPNSRATEADELF